MVEDFLCPNCGTDDIRGEPAGRDGRIQLTCEKCGKQWFRQPEVSCPRCHTPDPYHRQYWGWQYDDPAEAPDNPMADYDDVLWDEYRCQRCNHDWRAEADRRPGRVDSSGQTPVEPPPAGGPTP